ncbi:hypothetical protein C8J57DRAFT_1626279 [Mycena rebaudengoi]|nr:hypothetical protein C8J57DRAFT_1626279 [Mycena rebaudengoi]
MPIYASGSRNSLICSPSMQQPFHSLIFIRASARRGGSHEERKERSTPFWSSSSHEVSAPPYLSADPFGTQETRRRRDTEDAVDTAHGAGDAASRTVRKRVLGPVHALDVLLLQEHPLLLVGPSTSARRARQHPACAQRTRQRGDATRTLATSTPAPRPRRAAQNAGAWYNGPPQAPAGEQRRTGAGARKRAAAPQGPKAPNRVPRNTQGEGARPRSGAYVIHVGSVTYPYVDNVRHIPVRRSTHVGHDSGAERTSATTGWGPKTQCVYASKPQNAVPRSTQGEGKRAPTERSPRDADGTARAGRARDTRRTWPRGTACASPLPPARGLDAAHSTERDASPHSTKRREENLRRKVLRWMSAWFVIVLRVRYSAGGVLALVREAGEKGEGRGGAREEGGEGHKEGWGRGREYETRGRKVGEVVRKYEPSGRRRKERETKTDMIVACVTRSTRIFLDLKLGEGGASVSVARVDGRRESRGTEKRRTNPAKEGRPAWRDAGSDVLAGRGEAAAQDLALRLELVIRVD